MESLNKLILGATALFIASVYNMWVLSKLWAWYITPAFNVTVPKLYILYGLVLTAAFFTSVPKKDSTFLDQLFDAFLKGTVLLFLGWLCQAMFA